MKCPFALMLAVVCLISTATRAEDSAMTMGWGVSRCGELLRDRPAKGLVARMYANMIFTWVQGYFSGRNETLFKEHTPTKNLNSPSFNTYKQEAEIWKLCAATPGHNLIDVANEIWGQLSENKVPE